MYSIKKIIQIDRGILEKIIPGYSSSTIFEVSAESSDSGTCFTLAPKKLDKTYSKNHDYSDPSTLAHYNGVILQGLSFGAFINEELVGVILGEVLDWNSTVAVREFGVSPEVQGQGIGRSLLEHVLTQPQCKKLRGVICETQATNVPAIRFYEKMGFVIQGLDLSLYTNDDLRSGEVAIFLRKSLG